MPPTVEWAAKLCSIEGCGSAARARGWCSLHYQRYRAYGDATTTPEEASLSRRAARMLEPCVDCGGEKEPDNALGLRCESCRRERGQLRHQEGELRRRYGIGIADYDAMLEQQGGVCAICGGEPTKSYRSLDVDHDKMTGRVRGLLCRRCNTGLGYIEAGFHEPALSYLEGGEDNATHC